MCIREGSNMKKVFGFVLFFSLIFTNITQAGLISTFDNDAEGWRPANDVTLSWQNTGGNPGGFLQGNDWADGRSWYFVSPVSWEGNWSQYINGTLSFDLKLIDTGGGNLVDDNNDVIIYGYNGGALYYRDDGNYPASTWTQYKIILNAATFEVSEDYFIGVMSDVKELWIRGEFTDGYDIEGLDNVTIKEYINPPCEGDFDGDGDVDGSDLTVFAEDFGRTDCPGESMTEIIKELEAENEALKREIQELNARLDVKMEE